jgi:hypothetical protein
MATLSSTPPRRRTSKRWCLVTAYWCVLMSGLGADGFGQARAQSVYRCGSSYSNEANCEQGTAASVPLQGDTAHASKAPVGMAQQMQSEADRLEKIRQRETSVLTKQQAVSVHQGTTAHQATNAVAQKPPNDISDQHSQHKTKKRKKSTAASPYFTAKGAADSKKP